MNTAYLCLLYAYGIFVYTFSFPRMSWYLGIPQDIGPQTNLSLRMHEGSINKRVTSVPDFARLREASGLRNGVLFKRAPCHCQLSDRSRILYV